MSPQPISTGTRARVSSLARKLLRVPSLVLLLWHGSAVFANTISVLTSGVGGGYDEIVESLGQELNRASGVKVQTLLAPTADALSKLSADTVMIVTIGLQAAQQAIASADPRTPLLCVLLPRASFEAIPNPVRANRKLSALFIDQPAQRQLELLRAVLPAARNVGLVVGPATERDASTYRSLAEARGLAMMIERAGRETELYPVLQSVLRASDVLLALPDPYIVNAATAQNLLLTSFRFRVPVIGYSAAYVRAGALAAVYSSPRQIGLEAGQLVRQFLRTGGLLQAKYPRYFTVAVNRALADSLGYSIADEAIITLRLQQMEALE